MRRAVAGLTRWISLYECLLVLAFLIGGGVGAWFGKPQELSGPIDASAALVALPDRAPALAWALSLLGSAWAALKAAKKVQLREAKRLGKDDNPEPYRVASSKALDEIGTLASFLGPGFAVGFAVSTLARSGEVGLAGLVIALVVIVVVRLALFLRTKHHLSAS